jgi:hypothetical protein
MSTKLAVAAAANSMTQTAAPNTNRCVQSVLRLAPRSGTLYSVPEGPNNSEAFGAASALGGTGLSLNMDWTLPAAARWSLGAVLLKQSVVATRAVVGSVHAYNTRRGPVVQWETLSEHGTVGFHVRRYQAASGRFERVSRRLLPGLLHSQRGGTYRLRDEGVRVGETHVYEIVKREADASILVHGPFKVTVAPSAAAAGVTIDAQAKNRAADSTHQDGYSRRARVASKANHKRQRAKHTARKAQSSRHAGQDWRHNNRHALLAYLGYCALVRPADTTRALVNQTRQIAPNQCRRSNCHMGRRRP